MAAKKDEDPAGKRDTHGTALCPLRVARVAHNPNNPQKVSLRPHHSRAKSKCKARVTRIHTRATIFFATN
jgi:hypothetical protein